MTAANLQTSANANFNAQFNVESQLTFSASQNFAASQCNFPNPMPAGGCFAQMMFQTMMMQQMLSMMQQMLNMMQQMQQQEGGQQQGAGQAQGCNPPPLCEPEPKELPELEGKGKWFVGHGDYKKQDDGSYLITKGEYKDHTMHHEGEGKFTVCDPSGEPMGTWQSPNNKDKIASPLTFDLNGDGVSTTSVEDGKQFDIDGDGRVDQTAWAGAGDGILAFDSNGDGTVGADGRELFGNNTDIDGDGNADGFANGFDALRGLAEEHLGAEATADGKLDADELDALAEATDLGMIVDGELKGLDELGITEISLGYTEAGTNADEHGNEHRQVGEGFTMNGEQGEVNDVWFRYR
ncbi:MAG: hypothetical protein ACFCBW_18330 [Candidatus Competibacterales bacterium]